MNEPITRRAGAPRGFELLRWNDGVQLPVAGNWTVHGPHDAVYFTRVRPGRRDGRFPARLEQATVAVGADAADVTLTADVRLPDALAHRWPGRPVDTSVRVVVRSMPRPDRWAVGGSVLSGDDSMPVTATLQFHGVWRHGDGVYGWFGLTGSIVDPSSRTRDELRVSCDLMAYGPIRAEHAIAA